MKGMQTTIAGNGLESPAASLSSVHALSGLCCFVVVPQDTHAADSCECRKNYKWSH